MSSLNTPLPWRAITALSKSSSWLRNIWIAALRRPPAASMYQGWLVGWWNVARGREGSSTKSGRAFVELLVRPHHSPATLDGDQTDESGTEGTEQSQHWLLDVDAASRVTGWGSTSLKEARDSRLRSVVYRSFHLVSVDSSSYFRSSSSFVAASAGSAGAGRQRTELEGGQCCSPDPSRPGKTPGSAAPVRGHQLGSQRAIVTTEGQDLVLQRGPLRLLGQIFR